MKNKENLVDKIAKNIVVENFREQAETVVDSVGEATFGPLWKMKDVFANFYNGVKKAFFINFLLGLGFDTSTNNIDSEKIGLLSKRLSVHKNYEYITEILDSVFFSHSGKACTILGLITSKILVNNEITYVDRVIALALKDMFDTDLEMFTCFYLEENITTNNIADKRLSFIEDYSDEQRIALDKLIRLNLLGNDLAGGRFTSNNEQKHPLRYEKTLVSDSLYEYIQMIEKCQNNDSNQF